MSRVNLGPMLMFNRADTGERNIIIRPPGARIRPVAMMDWPMP